jgi:hypothetical protein
LSDEEASDSKHLDFELNKPRLATLSLSFPFHSILNGANLGGSLLQASGFTALMGTVLKKFVRITEGMQRSACVLAVW